MSVLGLPTERLCRGNPVKTTSINNFLKVRVLFCTLPQVRDVGVSTQKSGVTRDQIRTGP